MKIVLLEHPRVPSPRHFNDIANTPLWSCLMTGYAASSLLEAGYDAEILDLAQCSFDEAVKRVSAASPDILAVHTVYFWENTAMLFDMLARTRREGYGGVICLYGFCPTLAWKDLLQHVSSVDCVVVGEPEETLVGLAHSVASGQPLRPLPGLAARFEGRPAFSGFRAPVEPLDKLPFPARPDIEAAETVSILASRGCYNGCSFCLVPTLDGGRPIWRTRSVANVEAEIRALTMLGKRDIYFADPNFVGPGEAGGATAADLIAALSGLGISFGLETRASDVTESLMGSLRSAGLKSLLLGIESGNPSTLERLHKRITVAENERAIALVRDVGIDPEIGFIMFDPASTIEDIRRNLDFLQRTRLLNRLGRTVNLLSHEYIAFKGTPGYRIAAERGMLEPHGIFGFEGRLCYRDFRVEWLAGVAGHLCRRILREMGGRTPELHWRAEGNSNVIFQHINNLLVEIFGRMLEDAAHMSEPPNAASVATRLQKDLARIDAAIPSPSRSPGEEGITAKPETHPTGPDATAAAPSRDEAS